MVNAKRIGIALGLVTAVVGGIAARVVLAPRDPRVGEMTKEGIVVNTGQTIKPDGKLTLFSARPVDLVLSADGKTAYVKENEGLTIIELPSGKIRQRLPIKGGSSLTGLVLNSAGDRLYYSNSGSDVVELDVAGPVASVKRTFTFGAGKLTGASFPCGMVIRKDSLFVALSRANQVAELDLTSGKVVRTIDVDPAPFALALDPSGGRLWVTTWGQTPKPGELKSPSSGTDVRVDRRGIATGGTVSQIDLASGTVTATRVGAQPSGIAIDGDKVFVPLANADQVISISRSTGRLNVVWKAGTGSAPTAVAISGKGRLAVTCGGINSVVELANGKPVDVARSAWYPVAIVARNGVFYAVSAKGLGSRGNELRQGKFDKIAETEKFKSRLSPADAKSNGVYQFTGAFSIIPPGPSRNLTVSPATPAKLATQPVPVPTQVGEPSVFKHVVYVLKENRTYDQVFGDVKSGDGDASLCIYGERVTPNQHALAKQFVLLDNYYCNGVLSADGHSWSTEGNATSYFERTFGGWTRSYPYGDDPIAISSTGHIWDAVLDRGLTFRNYGEYDYATPTKGEQHAAILKDFESGKREVKFTHNIGLARLQKYSDPECPGWNMEIPDVLRASYFIRDVKAAEKSGKLARLSFVYLPQDHTSGTAPGTPTPEAHVADNDLAVGRVVDAVSHSRFWKDTVICVIEDDPQAGFDHVDGHRSTCLVISPYTRRGATVSRFYNQAGVLKTISHILGVQPSSMFERRANLFTDCFQAKPNLASFTAVPNRVPLDQVNVAKTNQSAMRIDLSGPDRVDERVFNRQLWAAAKGRTPYPSEFEGPHGKGLAARHLALHGSEGDD